MKSEDKNMAQLFKTAIKNEHLFYRMILKKQHTFFTQLLKISAKYSPLKPDLGIQEFNSISRFTKRDKIISIGWKCAYLLPHEKRLDFMKEISAILKTHSLGKEWQETLVTYTMIGSLCPPIYNLYIEKEEVRMPPSDEWGKLRVSLVLNPDTSIADINNAWPQIKKTQKSLWNGFKGFNLTKNSVRDLNEQRNRIMTELAPISDDERHAGLNTQLEEILAKKYRSNPAVARQEIQKQRRREGKKLMKVDIKEKLTDKEIVKKMHGLKGKAVRKAVANLRQRRHREKMTTF